MAEATALSPQQSRKRRVPRPYWAAGAATVVVIGWVIAAAGGGHAAAHPSSPLAPPLAACVRSSAVPCYGQDPLHEAYGMGALYARGITGAGTTVAVIDDGANPQGRADLAAFSRFFRLPPACVL
jgi:subtilisin family serine protease